ncbi:hypothetical protein KY338_01935 [Candidatus Woesearchaeota archaeon]|nr:hypothetical protein [Candidatus Woesearchaeota archaeon]MBW3005963.1 hypothetical protein [Candidatus Woesearchaeota archaeon]
MLKRVGKIKKKSHKLLFAIVIGFAVISFWRGIWGLMDIYLFPNNLSLSLWISVFVGIVILIITDYTTKELL